MEFKDIGARMGIRHQVACKYYKAAIKKMGVQPLPARVVKAAAQREKALVQAERALEKGAEAGKLLKDLTDANTITLMKEVRVRALVQLDDARLAEEKALGLTRIAGIMTDKIQLMEGEPTSIVRIEDRRQLDEIGKAILEEFERRGMILEGKVEEVG